ncbi:hypothetical protein GCM10023257_42140 [Streptomyces hyderabadensis]|uniref:Uncharacterized protein n=1 Tax=Streptomyces hyderabadensis TaxID=598549 RepID=A0ABP9IFL6_9ACTN
MGGGVASGVRKEVSDVPVERGARTVAGRGRADGVGACVDRVTFSKCGPLGGVVGSSVAASGPFALRARVWGRVRVRLPPSGDVNQNLLISPDQKHTVHDPIPTSL